MPFLRVGYYTIARIKLIQFIVCLIISKIQLRCDSENKKKT